MIIYVLTVVYNKRCVELPICSFFETLSDKDIVPIIYDNSTKNDIKQDNFKYCANKRFNYLGGKGNIGLSKGYNETIDFCLKQNDNGYICFFDDDANVDIRYFTILREAILYNSGSLVFFPVLICRGEIISPSVLTKGGRCRLFKNENEALNYTKKDITALNSGMSVNLRVYKIFRYNENLFLDCVDHDFMKRINADSIPYTVINYICEHEFSGSVHPPKESAVNRYKIFRKDIKNYYKGKPLLYYFTVGKRMLRLSVEYRTFAFVKITLFEGS